MKVGLLCARSGVGGIWTPSLDASAILGAAEINADGGVLGHDVELVFSDCGNTPAEAEAAVDALLEIDCADAIVGAHASNLRDAISQRISNKVPYIYTPQYEGIACGPSTVAIGSTDGELLGPALHWLREEKSAERFYFVGNDYIWPRIAAQTLRGLLRQRGGRLVGETFLPMRANDDLADTLAAIGKHRPHVVVMALLGQCAVDFNRAFAAAGLDNKVLRLGLIVDETVICGIGAQASGNLFTVSNYFADWRSRTNDGFLERYHEAFGEHAPPVSAASMSYYEGLHVVAGLANSLGTRRGLDLARHVRNSLPRPAARANLHNKPVGRAPGVHLGEADGVRFKMIATLGN
jgi:urea transport system substrate-binding protein